MTDASGRARLHLAKGYHELAVWKTGYETEPVPLTIDAAAVIRVEARAARGKPRRDLDGVGAPGYRSGLFIRISSMADTLPDRLSVNPSSPHYNAEVLQRDVGIRFNGKEKTNVEEYCVSEGWIRVEAGKAKDRYGNPLTIKLTGKVEPYFKDEKND
jgi:hypothetical protein